MVLRTLFVFVVLPCCMCRDTITATQPLKINETLLSKGNNFELGFFNPGNSTNWYIGIHYAKLPEKTIVWVLNRDDPINDTSAVLLTVDELGNLALYGHSNIKIPVWSTNISNKATDSGSSTISAMLLDTGNLVMINNNNGNRLWQSFDYPTDTLLPGMKLGLNKRSGLKWSLSSWKTVYDPGTGEYSYKIDLAGSPQFFLHNGSSRVWRSTPWPWSNQPANLSVHINMYTYVNNQDEICYMFFPNDPSQTTRMVMDGTGKLRLLTWHLNDDNQWDESYATPKNLCDLYAHCGVNSKCSPDNINRFECECLPGFEPRSLSLWSQRNASGGCVRKHVLPLAQCQNGDGFVIVAHVKIPDTSTAALYWDVECEQMCRSNCSCAAFMNIGSNKSKRSGCFMWFGQLIDIVQYAEVGRDLHVRNAVGAGNSNEPKGFLRRKMTLAVIITLVVSALFIFVTFAYCWIKRRRNFESIAKTLFLDKHDENMREPELPFFHLSTIIAATDNFSPANKLGQGGFGSVYKGQLLNGQKIAVKRLAKSSGQGVEEFRNEIMLIAKLQHRNLVKLLGGCVEGEEMMLIYEYMSNKSLDSFIFDQSRRSCLDWRMRFHIIIGVARGVLYLHQDSRLRIIHRDLKTSNVLLDTEMNPKISDFGMARLFTGDQIQGKTNKVVGTYGYMSPEYVVFGNFSIKSDVFSFGVILLEILSGTRNTSVSISLIGYVWKLWKEDRALEILDSTLQSYDLDEALRCIQIGLLCVEEEVRDRPTMSAVVLMLSSEIVLPSPKKPAYVFETSNEDNNAKVEEQGLCSTNQSTITEVIAR